MTVFVYPAIILATHVWRLVGHQHLSGLVFPLGSAVVCVERCAHYDVIESVSVQIGHTETVAEVGANLRSADRGQTPQGASEHQNLNDGDSSVMVSSVLSARY